MRKPESLIFDIDGTLWDNREVAANSYNRQLAVDGYGHITVTADQLLTLFGKTLPEIGDVLLAEIPDPELRSLLIDRCAQRSLMDLETDPSLTGYPGVMQTLQKLSKHYRLFIVSNSELGYPQLTMKRLGITHLITGHMCYGDTGLPKGDTLRKLMQTHHIENAVYVGDTQGDYEATCRAGLPFIWCDYGFGKPESYAARIHSFPELLELFPE